MPSHVPVLPRQTLEFLAPRAGETAVDCTAGAGGHAALVAERLGSTGTLVLVDLDPGSLAMAEARVRGVAPGPRVVTMHANFAEAPRLLAERGLAADVVLADLGFASMQVDTPQRGFSFMNDGPLDMRLNPTSGRTAAQLLASIREADLAALIAEFGEDRAAKTIARRICEARGREAITTTGQLAEIVRSAVGGGGSGGGKGIHPATRTFQALRIAVNDELGNLSAMLDAVERAAKELRASPEKAGFLRAGARVGFISFHSLEDRLVKEAFARMEAGGTGRVLTAKPVRPQEGEEEENPRARSARLRVVRIGGADGER